MMEEPDSSGSDVEQETKIQETQQATKEEGTDDSYSSSDSDEALQHKSLYLNVYKTGHVPGKYKGSMDHEAVQHSVCEMPKLPASEQENVDQANVTADETCQAYNDKEENVQVLPLTNERESESTEVGIFEKSMLIIPSLPLNDATEKKEDEKVIQKIPPPVPKKPSLHNYLSSKKEADVNIESLENKTSPNSRPVPRPRKSKLSRFSNSEENTSDDHKSTAPSPTPERENGKIESSVQPESEKMTPQDTFQPDADVLEKERSSSEEMLIMQRPVGAIDDCLKTCISLPDSVEVCSSKSADEANSTEDSIDIVDKDPTPSIDTMKTDFAEGLSSEQPKVLSDLEEKTTKNAIFSSEKDDSDNEYEGNATFTNDLQDTDSAKEDISDNESDSSFRTPDSHSFDDYYDSNVGLPLSGINTERSVITEKDEHFSNAKKTVDSQSNADDEGNVGKTEEGKGINEESFVVLRKGSVKETGYVSISSAPTSSELTDVTMNMSFVEKERLSLSVSVRDRISIFEISGQEIDKKSDKTNKPSFNKFSKSPDSNSNFDLLLKEEVESPIMTESVTNNVDQPLDQNECFCMSTGEKVMPVVSSKSEETNSSMQSVVIVSTDETQTVHKKSLDLETTKEYEQTVNITDETKPDSGAQSDESNSKDSEDDKPPPIPPKSEMVLLSLGSFITEEPPNIPPRSLAHNQDCNVVNFEKESIDHDDVNDIKGIHETDTQQSHEQITSQLIGDDGQTLAPHFDRHKSTLPYQQPFFSNMAYQQQQAAGWPSDHLYKSGNIQFAHSETRTIDHDNVDHNKDVHKADTQQSSTCSHEETKEGHTTEPHLDIQQSAFQYTHQIYTNVEYQNQQQQAPGWPQYYYMDKYGNIQYANPNAIYNPNFGQGMFYQTPYMPYYQQPQSFPHNLYTSENLQTSNRNSGYSSHQTEHPKDDLYEEVGQARSGSTTHTGNIQPSGMAHHAPKEKEQYSKVKHNRQPAHVKHQKTPEHHNIQHKHNHEPQGTGVKLTKSKSEDPVKRTTEEKSSTPLRKSATTPGLAHEKSGKSKGRNPRRLKEDIPEVHKEANKTEDYYIYFKGISPDTKKDNLSNFIEATTKGECDKNKMIFNHLRTCALVSVTLKKRPDLTKVEERIEKRGIDGKYPEVYELQQPKSVAVSSEEEIKNLESLGLFFESRKVGNSELSQEPFESEDGSCVIVQYGDPDVVKRVCGRQTPYIWESKTLRVSPYFECKAGAIWDSELHVLKIPDPVVVTLEPNYLLLLQRDCCKQLLSNLESNNCKPIFSDKGLELQCTLSTKTAGFKRLAREWETSSRHVVAMYVQENVFEKNLKSSEEVWGELLESIKSDNDLKRTDLVTSFDETQFSILLVGFKDAVNDAFNKLDEKQREIEKQLRRRTETKSFDALKLQLLGKIGFFEDIKKDFVDIEIQIGNGDITLEGQPEDISMVHIKIHEMSGKMSEIVWKHEYSQEFVCFLENRLVENIASVLKRNGLIAEWKIDEERMVGFALKVDTATDSQDYDYETVWEDDMYSKVDDIKMNVKDILNLELLEIHENVEDSVIDVMKSAEWITYLESITEDYENVAEVEFQERTGQIIMYGMKKEVQNLHKKVKEFIERNAVVEDTIKCGTISVRYINMHRKDLFTDLQEQFKQHKVRIETKDELVIIKGTKEGIAKTKEELKKVFDSIISEKYTIKKVAVQNVFRDVKDQGIIDVLEKETGCLIKLPGENETFITPSMAEYYPEDSDDEDDENDEYEVVLKGATGPRFMRTQQTAPPKPKGFTAPNGVMVTLVKGELGQQDGDVIVVTTSPNLNLSSGNACKSVLRVGGQSLQDECKKKYKKEIQFGEIAVIHGGSLECNRVYLTTLPNWTSESNAKQILEKLMKECLELASKHKKHSILFCAMGTGQLRYPTDIVAMVMYQAVIDFDQSYPDTTLKDIRFVLYQKDFPTIKAFEEEERLRLEGGGDRPTLDLKVGNILIELSVENIAQQKVDGILCSTSPNMDLGRNGACQALLKAGGKSLQEECKSKHNNKLEEGQVVEIGGGKLSCRSVFLTVLPGYSADAIQILTSVIQTLLKLAQAKGLTSVALPALGTGYLKYPKDQVCECMFKTVSDWAQSNPSSTIKTVRFIMHAKDHEVIQMFKSHIMNAKGRGKRESRRYPRDPNKLHKTTYPQGQNKSVYNAHANGVQIGKIKLSVLKDDILGQKTDAIVSSVGEDFEFYGAVAQELKAKYPEMEKKCRKKVKQHHDGVVVTDGFGLPAKSVLHVQFADNLSAWKKRFHTCLELVNKKKYKSVAFPVVGTGKGFKSFNPENITECLFDAISDFTHANKNHSVREVRLIVYKGQPAMYDPILNKLHKKIQEAVVSANEGLTKNVFKAVKTMGKKAIEVLTGSKEGRMSEEERKKMMECTSSMEVEIYSDSKQKINDCKKEIDAKLEQMYAKEKISEYKDTIKSLTKEEEQMLDIVALANINIDTQAGIITIDGPLKQVSDVKHQLYTILLQLERHKLTSNTAEELFKMVQWHYEEVTETEFKLIPYNKILNQKIENAYKKNQSEYQFEDDDGEICVIDFQNLVEYRKSDEEDQLKVLRKDVLKAVKSALPDDWTEMKEHENIKVVPLPTTDKAYQDIEQRFITEVKTGSYAHRLNFDPNNLKVNKVERIQNKTLYRQYQAKMKLMKEQKQKLPQNMPIERELWHGTKSDAVTSIQMHGFNRSYSGNANGDPWYGEGVYFAANASYSARGWLSGAGTGSKGYMFLVKTLTGQYCQGKKGMRYLPAVNASDPTVLYDCAVDNLANPMEFVIFNDTQAYPAYIITFTT